MTITLNHASCLYWLAEYDGPLFDSCVTDPPYHLTAQGSKSKRSNLEQPADKDLTKINAGSFRRLARGFMGKEWDGGDIAFRPETWRAVYDALKPGAHLVAFSGTRTYHRMACAIEDAGFEIRDQLFWAYGSGFPKSHDVSKGIDKLDATVERRRRNLSFTSWMRQTGITAAAINDATSSFMGSHYLTDREQAAVPTEEMFSLLRPLLPKPPKEIEALIAERTVESANFKSREIVGVRTTGIGTGGGSCAVVGDNGNMDITAPATAEAEQWQGWGTALKPALEPICLARKPLSEKSIAANVLKHGTGAINIDGCRVGMSARDAEIINNMGGFGVGGRPRIIGNSDADFLQGTPIKKQAEAHKLGRWPANLIWSVPCDEYELREDISPQQKCEVMEWLYANS